MQLWEAEALFKLTRTEILFNWDDSCQTSTDYLKNCLTSEPILHLPDFLHPFFNHTDTCDLGLGAALEHFRPYVKSLNVTVYADHNSLRWLMNHPNPSGRLARWSLRLQDFDFSIVHKPGARNTVPDTLSRSLLPHSTDPIDILPAHAVIGGLDMQSLSPVMITVREQLKQLQKDDPMVGNLIALLEEGGMDEEHVVQDGLLYKETPK
ncbi:integrin alpha-M-like [Tachysurus ichikawai]